MVPNVRAILILIMLVKENGIPPPRLQCRALPPILKVALRTLTVLPVRVLRSRHLLFAQQKGNAGVILVRNVVSHTAQHMCWREYCIMVIVYRLVDLVIQGSVRVILVIFLLVVSVQRLVV